MRGRRSVSVETARDIAEALSGRRSARTDVKLVQAVAGHANPLITLKRYSTCSTRE
jgi:hypothetical protein